MNQKGLTPVIILLLVVLVGGIVFFVFQNIKNSQKPAPSQIVTQASPASSPAPVSSGSGNKTNPVQGVKQISCNSQIDVCFENNDIVINIKQGYLESTDRWIGDSFKLIGKGGQGYNLALSSDFLSTITLDRAKSSFDDGTSITIYPQVQKNVTPVGSYRGTLILNTPNSSQPKVAKLTVNFLAWDQSSIHLDPVNLDLNYNLTTHKMTFLTDINPLYPAPKFYYFGSS